MDLSLPWDNEETVARLFVRNVLYIPETAMRVLPCVQLDNVGIYTNVSDGKCISIDGD